MRGSEGKWREGGREGRGREGGRERKRLNTCSANSQSAYPDFMSQPHGSKNGTAT